MFEKWLGLKKTWRDFSTLHDEFCSKLHINKANILDASKLHEELIERAANLGMTNENSISRDLSEERVQFVRQVSFFFTNLASEF